MRFFVLLAWALSLGCAHSSHQHQSLENERSKIQGQLWPERGPSPESPTPTPPHPLTAPWMRWIGLEDIRRSLPTSPIIVGFDIDDTVLFSSPGSFYGLHNSSGKAGKNIYGEKPHRNPQFFNDWTDRWDEFSLPKYSARQLIQMHLERGDQIYFITARPYSGPREKLTRRLKRIFRIDPMNPVIFNGFTVPKVDSLKKYGVKIYYGDADSDVADAMTAGARPIRVLRPINSTDDRPVRYGTFNEEILVESDR